MIAKRVFQKAPSYKRTALTSEREKAVKSV